MRILNRIKQLTRLKFQCVLLGAMAFVLWPYQPAAEAVGEAGGKLEVGPEFHYFQYKEPDVMEEEGFMIGAFANYVYRFNQNQQLQQLGDLLKPGTTFNQLGVEGKFSLGEVDYESNNTGSIDDIDDFLAEVRVLTGIDLPTANGNLFTPYIGFGYRYWMDDLGGKTSTTGHFGFDRESQYYYLPLGIAATIPIDNKWTAVAKFEYDIFLYGKQKSHLEDVSSALNTLENDQNDGFGLRGSLAFNMRTDDWDIFFEPFVRYWNIDDSSTAVVTCGGTPCALGFEPKNRTIEGGMRVGAKF